MASAGPAAGRGASTASATASKHLPAPVATTPRCGTLHRPASVKPLRFLGEFFAAASRSARHPVAQR